MNRIFQYSLGVAALLVLNAGPALAAGSVKTTSPVWAFDSATGDFTTLAGSSTLVRTSKGISMSIHTTGLPAGHAVTVWFCISRKDGINFDCVRAAGHVVGSDGILDAGGATMVGDRHYQTISPAFGADGLGLMDSLHESVTLVVRDHGPAVPGKFPEQIHTFQPDCTTCADPDPQFSDHPAP